MLPCRHCATHLIRHEWRCAIRSLLAVTECRIPAGWKPTHVTTVTRAQRHHIPHAPSLPNASCAVQNSLFYSSAIILYREFHGCMVTLRTGPSYRNPGYRSPATVTVAYGPHSYSVVAASPFSASASATRIRRMAIGHCIYIIVTISPPLPVPIKKQSPGRNKRYQADMLQTSQVS